MVARVHGPSYFKDGGLNRDPHQGTKVTVWKRGAAQTITKGGEQSPAKSNGRHGKDER